MAFYKYIKVVGMQGKNASGLNSNWSVIRVAFLFSVSVLLFIPVSAQVPDIPLAHQHRATT
jgi:hypothetical protein